jgi:tRNA_anti-like
MTAVESRLSEKPHQQFVYRPPNRRDTLLTLPHGLCPLTLPDRRGKIGQRNCKSTKGITFMKARSAFVGCTLLACLSADIALAEEKKAAPIKITAEDLVKESNADNAKVNAKYKGKVLRVTGKVDAIYDDILYLTVRVDAGEYNCVCIRYGSGNKPAVKKGDTATFEGKFDLVAVLGPALVDCKLVPVEPKK